MAEKRKINTRNNIRRRQRQEEEEERIAQREEEERIAQREEEERIARQNIFRNENRDLGFRRDIREIGGNPRRIRNNDSISAPLPPAPPLSEIAQDLANERRTITAEYFRPGLTRDEYRRQGFQDLEDGEIVVNDLQNANFIEHITATGERKIYSARNFRLDKYDPENLLEAKDITDESTVDPDNEIQIQLEALRTG